MHLFHVEAEPLYVDGYTQIVRAKSARQAADIAFDHSDEVYPHGFLETVAVSKMQSPEDGRAGLVYETNIVRLFNRKAKGRKRPAEV